MMAEDLRGDVDRQAAGDHLGGEHATEIMP
jgi:hypothetical protein